MHSHAPHRCPLHAKARWMSTAMVFCGHFCIFHIPCVQKWARGSILLVLPPPLSFSLAKWVGDGLLLLLHSMNMTGGVKQWVVVYEHPSVCILTYFISFKLLHMQTCYHQASPLNEGCGPPYVGVNGFARFAMRKTTVGSSHFSYFPCHLLIRVAQWSYYQCSTLISHNRV